MNAAKRILIVDEDVTVASQLAETARNCAYLASIARTYDEFVAQLRTSPPSVVLIDQAMPGKEGLEFLRALSNEQSKARVILSGTADNRKLRIAAQLGQILALDMADPLIKPFSIHAFRCALKPSVVTGEDTSRHEFEAAIENHRIKPYFQPRASLCTGDQWRVSGVEAVARWHGQEATIVKQEEIIELAEKFGLVPLLIDGLVFQVAEQLKAWSKLGHEFDASIALPYAALTDRMLADRLIKLVRKERIDTSRLTLGVSENAVLQNSAETLQVLSDLKSKGFRLAINNFCTGYFSLDQLNRLPFLEIRMDRSFVAACDANPGARTIVEATVLLGHRLGMDIGASGVDDRRTFEYLGSLGCKVQQGRFVGRILCADDLVKHASEWNPGARHVGPIAASSPQACPI